MARNAAVGNHQFSSVDKTKAPGARPGAEYIMRGLGGGKKIGDGRSLHPSNGLFVGVVFRRLRGGAGAGQDTLRSSV